MRRINGMVLVCLLLVTLLGFYGCKSAKVSGDQEKVNTKELKAFVASMQEHEPAFRTFSARLNVDLQMEDKTVGSRVEFKLVKDSALQLSVQPFLGIEVFRMELTPDSVKVMDRMNKRYMAERYAALKEEWPIDFNFYNLQALFVHQLFLPGEQEVEGVHYDQFHLEREGAITRLHVRDRMDLRYCFEANSDEQLLSTLITEGNGRYSLLWKYLSLESQPSVSWLFPLQMQVAFRDEGIRKGGMDIRFSRLQWNKALNMDFSIPAKYKRITFADVLKMIGGNQ